MTCEQVCQVPLPPGKAITMSGFLSRNIRPLRMRAACRPSFFLPIGGKLNQFEAARTRSLAERTGT